MSVSFLLEKVDTTPNGNLTLASPALARSPLIDIVNYPETALVYSIHQFYMRSTWLIVNIVYLLTQFQGPTDSPVCPGPPLRYYTTKVNLDSLRLNAT